MKTPIVTVITHYDINDTDFMEDYCSMKLFIDGTLVFEGRDAYHDNSRDKIDGFILGLKHAWGKPALIVKEIKKADYE